MRPLPRHHNGRLGGEVCKAALSPLLTRHPSHARCSRVAARRLEPASHCSRVAKYVCAVEPANYNGGQQDDVAEAGRPAGVHKNRRVLLKISGEALQGGVGFGVDPKMLHAVAKEIATAVSEGVQVAVVVGGGNFFRGATAYEGLERATADYVGMLATCMNSIMLQSALEQCNVPTRVQSAIEMREICEPWVRRRAIRHLERGLVVIFAAGTGNPFFTTDTAAALRAAEINADCVFKATKVDGVFDCDPETHPEAKLHRELTYRDVIAHNLRVMDETAITICKENNIPVRVFNIARPGNIMRALAGDSTVGTIVSEACPDLPSRTLPEAEIS